MRRALKGIEKMKVNIPETLIVARRCTVRKGKCWSNAVQAARAYTKQGVQYVEGWIVFSALNGTHAAVEHGWCELPDGSILDVSVTERAGAFVRINDAVDMRYTYFPGIKYHPQDIASLPLTHFPTVHHIVNNPSTWKRNGVALYVYFNAWIAAQAHAEQASKPE